MIRLPGIVRPYRRRNVPMIRGLVRLLVAAIVVFGSAAAAARAADSISESDRKTLEDTLYHYMSQHPGVLLDALHRAEERVRADDEVQAHRAMSERRRDILEDPTSPVGGNPQGNVTIVEFFDYRCPYCKQMEPALESLLREDGNIRIVYKEFPILGKDSVYASHMALAAKKQGKYDAFHAAMMATKGH